MTQVSAPALDRQRGVSAFCSHLCGALAVFIPLALLAFWVTGSVKTLALVGLVPHDIIHHLDDPLSLTQRTLGALICLVPALLLGYGLLRARRALAAYARGDFFSSEVVAGLRGYAGASFWAAVASFVAVPLVSVAMTGANPAGTRELSLDLTGGTLLGMTSAAILWVIASVMARASVIAREHANFI